MKAKLAAANEKMMQQKLSEIPAEQDDVLLFEEDLDVPVMRNAVNALVEAHSGICGIFAGSDVDGYHVRYSFSKTSIAFNSGTRFPADRVRGGSDGSYPGL